MSKDVYLSGLCFFISWRMKLNEFFPPTCRRLPPVLGYSVSDELIPKWNYLNQTCQYASFEVIRFPAYFSYPLERVIMNRYEYLKTVKRMPVQLLPVDEILRYGDSDFARIIANDQDEGQDYKKFVSERNKIRRQA